jgi:hypothetical protein
MQAQGKDLSDIVKVRLAEFMSGRPMGSTRAGDAASLRCESAAD